MHENFIPHSGFVTAIDDPEGLGRVKVHCETIDGTNPAQETIWVNILKGPEGFGSDSPSPPQVGTRVIVQVNKTNPSLRNVTSVVGSQKQKANPSMPGNRPLYPIRQPYEEKENTSISGPGKGNQEAITNGRGSDKQAAPVSNMGDKSEPTIADRHEIQTQISGNPQMQTQPPPVKSVSTSLTPDSSIITSAQTSMLAGVPLNISNIFDHIKGDLLNELKAAVPTDVITAMQSIAGISASFTPVQVDGFQQDANLANPATIGANMVNALKSVTNVKELRTTLNTIMTDPVIKDLSSMPAISMNIDSAFGLIPSLLNPDGTIEHLASDLLNLAKSLFGSAVAGIPILGGASTFLPGSQIPNDLVERMIPANQAAFKTMFEKLAGQGNPARSRVESKLSTLKSTLGG